MTIQPTPQPTGQPTSRPRQLVLNAFLGGSGHHPAAARVLGHDEATTTSAAWYQGLARTAERGVLQSIFFADGPSHPRGNHARAYARPEPRILLTAIAAVTEHIGLIATSSTTYNEPYTLAREFASLDTVSGGRAAWNVVTTGSKDAADNYGGGPLPTHAERYSRAEEFLQVVLGLWAGWAEDPSAEDGIRTLDHTGEHFSVRGPLTVGRSDQGHPVVVQAGSSEAGIALAGKYAEAVFTATPTLEQGRDYYAKLKQAVLGEGRDPDHVLVLPGLMPFVAETEEEARALKATYDAQIDVEAGLNQLSSFFGVDTSGFDLDGPVPFDQLPTAEESEGIKSRIEILRRIAEEQNLTVRGLLEVLANGRGHLNFVGSYVQVADFIEEWFTTGAADGFNLLIPAYPVLLDDFIDHVVPILQERGLFHTAYEGRTLRENYGLPVPTSEETLKELARLA